MFGIKDFNLEGNVAIVTGGGRGIGKAISKELAGKKCDLVICGRNEGTLKQAKKELGKKGARVLAIKADVSKPKECKNVVGKTIREFGKLNILVNNAGIAARKQLAEMKEEEIDSILDVNLKGLIHLTKEALPHISGEEYGRIINISSGLGKSGAAGFTVYCATKFGVIGFTEALSKELDGNVKAFTVCPGLTSTRMAEQLFGSASGDDPADVAKVVMKVVDPDTKIGSGDAVGV